MHKLPILLFALYARRAPELIQVKPSPFFPAFWLSSTHCTVATQWRAAFVKWSGCLLAAAFLFILFRFSALVPALNRCFVWAHLHAGRTYALSSCTLRNGQKKFQLATEESWHRYVHKRWWAVRTAHVQWHSRSEPMNMNSSIQKLHLFRPPIYFACSFVSLIRRFFSDQPNYRTSVYKHRKHFSLLRSWWGSSSRDVVYPFWWLIVARGGSLWLVVWQAYQPIQFANPTALIRFALSGQPVTNYDS